MAYAGADGKTREEMSRALHFPADDAPLQLSFATLTRALTAIAARSAEHANEARPDGSKRDVLQLRLASRLFGQRGYEFRRPFVAASAAACRQART